MARKKNDLDAQIEQAYYRLARGKQINIMDIPKLFKECEASVKQGIGLDDAVMSAVRKFCTG